MSANPPIPATVHEHIRAGRNAQAEALLRREVQRRPDHADARHLLGSVLHRSGQAAQAEYHYRRSLELDPGRPAFHNNYGVLLSALGRVDEAVARFREAVRLDPGYAIGWTGLAMALMQAYDLDGSADAAQRAVALAPQDPDGYVKRFMALSLMGRSDDAVDALLAARAAGAGGRIPPGPMLVTLNSCVRRTPEQVFEEHVRAGRALGEARPIDRRWRCTREPERRLRVGYLSPDFYSHSVAYFIEGVIAAHDRERVEVVCYAASDRTDATTARIRASADRWVEAWRLDDAALDRRIRDDAVDVLVDLAGHTANNRLGAVASKPAPVIATYIGYPNTTGLAAVDARIVDGTTDPAGAENLATETLVRLARCFLAYRPAESAPAVVARDAAAPVTFGSFNAIEKVNAGVLDVWARILAAVPGSRLVLKAWALADTRAGEPIRRHLAAAGVEPARVVTLPRSATTEEHLGAYGEMDIALDPFPYNGTTTTCEALWMGVPVVTMRGAVHAGRVGASLLDGAGLHEFIADGPDGYIARAVGLARDRARLGQLRASLRERVRRSPLCDTPGMARALEGAYRELWRRWCAAPAP